MNFCLEQGYLVALLRIYLALFEIQFSANHDLFRVINVKFTTLLVKYHSEKKLALLISIMGNPFYIIIFLTK